MMKMSRALFYKNDSTLCVCFYLTKQHSEPPYKRTTPRIQKHSNYFKSGVVSLSQRRQWHSSEAEFHRVLSCWRHKMMFPSGDDGCIATAAARQAPYITPLCLSIPSCSVPFIQPMHSSNATTIHHCTTAGRCPPWLPDCLSASHLTTPFIESSSTCRRTGQ